MSKPIIVNASSINEAQRGVGGAVPGPKFITGEFPQISFFSHFACSLSLYISVA